MTFQFTDKKLPIKDMLVLVPAAQQAPLLSHAALPAMGNAAARLGGRTPALLDRHAHLHRIHSLRLLQCLQGAERIVRGPSELHRFRALPMLVWFSHRYSADECPLINSGRGLSSERCLLHCAHVVLGWRLCVRDDGAWVTGKRTEDRMDTIAYDADAETISTPPKVHVTLCR